jgi:hypothetical protein
MRPESRSRRGVLKTRRYARPERLALAIVAASLTRWRHPNLRAWLRKNGPWPRPRILNTIEGCRGGNRRGLELRRIPTLVTIGSHGNKLLESLTDLDPTAELNLWIAGAPYPRKASGLTLTSE